MLSQPVGCLLLCFVCRWPGVVVFVGSAVPSCALTHRLGLLAVGGMGVHPHRTHRVLIFVLWSLERPKCHWPETVVAGYVCGAETG